MKKLPFKRTVYNVDGTLNRHGTIDRACNLLISRGNKKARQWFYVTNLGQDRFILGYPWFREFQPDIDWANGMLRGPTIQMETLLFGTLQLVFKGPVWSSLLTILGLNRDRDRS